MLSYLMIALLIPAASDPQGPRASQPATTSAAAASGATQRLAVLKVAAQGAPTSVADTLTQVITEQAGRTPGFNAISQAELSSLLGVEKQRQLLGCADQSCLAEIGGALGARLVLSATLGKVGESYVLSLQLIDSQKAQIKARESRTISSAKESELIAAARDLTHRVLTGTPLDTTGKIKFAVTPPGAKIVIDGKLLGTSPLEAPVVLEQGTHRVHIEADNYVPFDSGLDAVAGQTLFNAVDLVSTAPIANRGRSNLLSSLGWTTVGVGTAALGAGIAFGVLAQGSYNQYKAAQYKIAEAQPLRNDTATFSTVANFCYLGAGVFGLVGVGLEVLSLGKAEPEKRTEVQP